MGRVVRRVVLVVILLGGLLAFYTVTDLPPHEGRLITLSFLSGVILGRVMPRLWRWADYND